MGIRMRWQWFSGLCRTAAEGRLGCVAELSLRRRAWYFPPIRIARGGGGVGNGDWIFVLSRNDLEARTLADMVGENVVESNAILDNSKALAGRRVAVVEMRGPAPEGLESAGEVRRLDHHLYWDSAAGQWDDRRHPLSALEQAARLLDVELLPWQRLVVANDAGSWPRLMEIDYDTLDAVTKDEKTPDWLGRLREQAAGLPGVSAIDEKLRRRVIFALAVRLRDLACGAAGPSGDPDREEAAVFDTLKAAFEELNGAAEKGTLRDFPAGLEDGHDYCLVQARLDHRLVIDDALYLRRIMARSHLGADAFKAFRYLVLFLDDGKDGVSSRLIYSGEATDQSIIGEILGGTGKSKWLRLDLCGGGGANSSHLGAQARGEADAACLKALADDILNATLGLARPLTRWSTRFLQVLDHGGSSALPQWGEDARAAFDQVFPEDQDRAYFLDYVRAFLVAPPLKDGDLGDAPFIHSFRLKEPALGRAPGLRVEFRPYGGKALQTLAAPVTDVFVHLCFNRLAIVEWVCANCWSEPPAGNGSLFERLLWESQIEAEQIGTIGRLLDFNNRGRQCYSPYEECAARDRATITLTWPDGDAGTLEFLQRMTAEPDRPIGWFGLLARRVMAPFGLDGCKLMLDERARVIAGVALAGSRPAGSPTALKRERRIFARLADVAGSGADYPYDDIFNQRILGEIAYRRFEDKGTLFGVDDHAFTAWSYGRFAYEHIVGRQMCGPYRWLYLIGLFYRSVFHKFFKDIAALARERLKCDLGDKRDRRADLAVRVHKRRTHFLGFANALWFEDVSGHMQGVDLFRMLRERLGLRGQYEEIQAELERFDSIEKDDAESRSQSLRQVLSVLGGLVVTSLLLFDGIGNFYAIGDDNSPWLWTFVSLVGGVLTTAVTWRTLNLGSPSLLRWWCDEGAGARRR